jgi:hypothetical protein
MLCVQSLVLLYSLSLSLKLTTEALSSKDHKMFHTELVLPQSKQQHVMQVIKVLVSIMHCDKSLNSQNLNCSKIKNAILFSRE